MLGGGPRREEDQPEMVNFSRRMLYGESRRWYSADIRDTIGGEAARSVADRKSPKRGACEMLGRAVGWSRG